MSFAVCVAVMLAVFVFYLIPQSDADPDLWWHLRDVECQIHALGFLQRDIFSYSVYGAPWIDHEWLAEVPFYLGWRWLGPRGVYLVTVSVIELIFLALYSLAYRRSQSAAAALLACMAGAVLATVSFGPRTLLFGWLCLVAELILLARFREGKRGIQLLPVLFTLWINMHGSWLIGMVLFILFIATGWFALEAGGIRNTVWLSDQRRILLIVLGFSAGALWLNPYGWRLIIYPFDLAFRQHLNIENVEEWHSLDLHSPRGKFFFLLIALMITMQLLRRQSRNLCDLAFCLIAIYAAFAYTRFLFLAALLLTPMTATVLAREQPFTERRRNRPLANVILLLMLVPLVLKHLPSALKFEDDEAKKFPVHAIGYLQTLPAGNVLSDYFWGGYLIWNVRQISVFIDPRADIYERAGVFQDYLDATQLRDTFAVFDKYRIRYVLLPRTQPLAYLLKHAEGWEVDYEDETAVVFKKRR